MEQLQSKIESLLFVSNKPLNANSLAKYLQADKNEVLEALQALSAKYNPGQDQPKGGIVLLESAEGWQLATNPQNSEVVRNFLNVELREKLSDASVETLAIIAYRQPISRAEIEAIRGVNCQYSIRHLLIRGLIQKIANPEDSRQNLYETTTEFLQHLGLSSVKDLPDFQTLVEKIKLPETQTPNNEQN